MIQKVADVAVQTGIETKPLSKSTIAWGGAAAALAGAQGLLTHFGVVNPGEIQELTGNLVALISGLIVIWKRITTVKLIAGLIK